MLIFFILFFISFLPSALSFKTKVCDCVNPQQTGILQFADSNCEPDKAPLETTAEECRIMREGRRCDEHPMTVSGTNWRYTKEPEEISYWLRTITVFTISCTLEEVTLFQDSENSNVSTPLGTVKPTAGVLSHNHLTLIWDTKYTTKTEPKQRHLESGIGTLINIPSLSKIRLQDDQNQLDFHLIYNPRCIPPQTECVKKAETFDVIGDNHLYVITKPILTKMKAKVIEPRPKSTVPPIVGKNLDITAHLQYIRDQLIDHENDLSKSLQAVQCDVRKAIHAQAISTAQYNGWLAASQLKLPECTKLVAAGQTAVAIKCNPIEVEFTTVITSCGPQPKYKNSTINLDGWELVGFSPCYWTTGFVNFNDKPHAYRNNTWQPIEATVELPQRKITNSFRYEDVTFFNYEHQSNPAYVDSMANHMNIMADIAAAMNEHSAGNFSENHAPSTMNVLVSAIEKEGFAAWFESFKIFIFISILIIIILIILRICYACGCFKIIYNLCCKPPPKCNSSIELATRPTTNRTTRQTNK